MAGEEEWREPREGKIFLLAASVLKFGDIGMAELTPCSFALVTQADGLLCDGDLSQATCLAEPPGRIGHLAGPFCVIGRRDE